MNDTMHAGEEAWVLEFPLPDKPESINHGSSGGFNFGGSLGFVYEAMGVHSSVICGKKQVEDVGRDEMVSRFCAACLLEHLDCSQDACLLTLLLVTVQRSSHREQALSFSVNTKTPPCYTELFAPHLQYLLS